MIVMNGADRHMKRKKMKPVRKERHVNVGDKKEKENVRKRKGMRKRRSHVAENVTRLEKSQGVRDQDQERDN